MRIRFLVRVAALCVSLFACVSSQAASVVARGPGPATQAWSAEQLKNTFASDVKSVEYSSKGEKHTANAIPLTAIIRALGISTDLKMDPKADPKIKNFDLRFTVLVQGGDGYSAVFSMGELLPDIGNHAAWLALDVDGEPLAERDQPARLIVPDDAKPGRWVHGVSSITVIDCVATTQPSH